MQYKPGKDHSNDDTLSRQPLPEMPTDAPLPGETVLLFDTLNSLATEQIRQWTNNIVKSANHAPEWLARYFWQGLKALSDMSLVSNQVVSFGVLK